MRTIGQQGKNVCTLSSHRATRELYAKVPSHRASVGALCEGSMRIELRSELYAKGALCGSTELPSYRAPIGALCAPTCPHRAPFA